MAVISLSFAEMIANQAKETHALSQKLAVTAGSAYINGVMGNGNVCLYEFNTPIKTFNSSTAATAAASVVSLPGIHVSPVVGSPYAVQVGMPISSESPDVIVQSVKVTNFVGSGNFWKADWVIDFKPSTLVRSLRPITISTQLMVDRTTPSATTITGCNNAGTLTQIAVCGGGCGGAWPKVLGMIASYNWEGKDGTLYQYRYTNCLGPMAMSSWEAGGANKYHGIDGSAFYICSQ